MAEWAAAREAAFEELAESVRLLERQGAVLKQVVRLVRPSVVHIEAEKQPAGSSHPESMLPVEEAGAGVVVKIKDKFYVLTNRHVVLNAPLDRVHIRLADGRRLHPLQILSDPGTDVAVLPINADRLVPARLGEDSPLEIGDFVLAFGSPFGLSHSVTYGIVSATGRRDLDLGTGAVEFQDFIQTDAAINPGNSGGPLLNLRGEVVGLNTAIASNSGGNEGIGFSIPVDMAIFVARQLTETGTVARAYLGVQMKTDFSLAEALSMGMPRLVGARVSAITPRSPADQADIRVGDVIVRFNGVEVEDDGHLVNLVSQTPIHTAAPLELYRDGQGYRLTIRVGTRSKFESPSD
jgi:serine protease Do